MALYSDLPLRLHASVADGGLASTGQGYSSVLLWYAVRAVDTDGRGWAEVNLSQMAESLGRSPVSLKRYLRQGMQEAVYQADHRRAEMLAKKAKAAQVGDLTVEQPGVVCLLSNKETPEGQAEKPKAEATKRLNFFRSVTKLGNGNYRIYYSSLFEVCRHLGLTHWGAVTEIKVSELRHMKAIATEVQIQRLQKCSQYQAKREHKRPTVEPEAITQSHHSRGKQGNILHKGKQMTFVNGDFVAYGTRQTTIAKSFDRSDRTIRKRLSKKFREYHNQPEIQKTQLAQTSDALNARILSGDRFHKVFRCFGQWFEFKCNVYAESRELISMKMSRRVFNKLVASDFAHLNCVGE